MNPTCANQKPPKSHHWRWVLISLFLLSLGISMGLHWNGATAQTSSQEKKADLSGYKKSVEPFLKSHCTKCHGPDRQSGKLTLHDIQMDLANGKDLDKWENVLKRLKLGEMPPEKEPRPNAHHTKAVVDWITAELKKAKGDAVAGGPDLLLPRYGNLVDHDALFNDPEMLPLDAPPRLWRISPYIYDAFVEDLTRNRIKISNPFSLNSKGGFLDYAGIGTIDEPTTNQLIRNALAIVRYQTRHKIEKGQVKSQFGATREFMPLFDPKGPKDEDIIKAINRQFESVLLREPTEKELNRFVTLMRKNIKDAGQEKGVRTTLAAILLSPELLYRSELGAGEPDNTGKVRLTPREIAYAISYTLTDERPDRTLLEAVEKGKLDTKEGVAEQVERILKDERADKPRILRFFQEFFGYREALSVFKDQKEFKDHEARVLVADTDRLIEYILEKDQNVFSELLTTNKSFVNYRKDKRKGIVPATKRKVNLSYSLNKWTRNQPISLPKNHRAGILTQPSWLVAFSMGSDNHAIHRGKWVREFLLGGHLPDVPITVDAQLPEDPDKTLRQRMVVTQKEYCWNCHKKMNPLGLTFEMYDHFGRYRTEELDKPVDATGIVDLTGRKEIEGKVDNAIEMLHKLAKSEYVQQVFIRHAFRYFLGRNESLGDAKTLREANQAYEKSGGSMKALITSLLTSESFLYRVPRISTQAKK